MHKNGTKYLIIGLNSSRKIRKGWSFALGQTIRLLGCPLESFRLRVKNKKCSNINKKYPENGPECVSFDRVGLKTALDISLFKNNRLTVGIRGCLSSNFILEYVRVLKGRPDTRHMIENCPRRPRYIAWSPHQSSHRWC